MNEREDTVVRRAREGEVEIVTLSRPAARNAIDAELATALGAAIAAADADPDVAVIVVTGDGPVFCAGADLKKVRDEPLTSTDRPDWGFAGFTQHDVSKPVVAALNGSAFGGGTEIALACDLVVMADDAVLGLPEVTRGLMAGAGGVIRLARQVPPRIAAEAVLTGRPLEAVTAERWGLVNRVVPRDQVMTVALDLARTVAANAPLAVRASREIVRCAAEEGSPWDTALWKRQDELNAALLESDDVAEGTAAFAERRTPVWSGR